MADYLVEKVYDPNKSEWDVEAWNYRFDMQEAWRKLEHKVPGQDFVKITNVGTEEDAKRQAKAYFDGTHEEPGEIDAWVQSLKGP